MVSPASSLVPLPATGRRYRTGRTVRLGDVGPSGRLRLDAAARLLQDVANDDAVDAGLAESFAWVVRRTRIDVTAAPRLGERLEMTTFCSGTGRAWAERRTSVTGADGGALEAASLWVCVDPGSGRPRALGNAFDGIYGESAAGRRVSTRLLLPSPPPDAERRPWNVRRVDLDVFGHVNNSVAFAVLHEVLDERWGRAGPRGVVELEYASPILATDAPVELLTADGGDGAGAGPDGGAVGAWLVVGDDGGETVRVAARWREMP